MLFNIPIDRAQAILADAVTPVGTERVSVLHAAGRILARDTIALRSVPPFDRSPYDGYALRGEDTAGASRENPAILRVTQEIPAGCAPQSALREGECAKILTGAPVPEGANAVIKYEVTEFTDTEIKVFSPVSPNTDIVPEGEDIMQGDTVALRGDVITPALAGVFAGQGIAEVEVYKRPCAALLCTGSELLQPGEAAQEYKIYNSNSACVGAYLSRLGLEVYDAGIVPDETQAIAQRICALLPDNDVIVTTGGACLGDYDYAATAFDAIGAEILFHKVDIKPGSALLAAVKDGKLILSLSGNPGAALVGLCAVAAPALRKLCAQRETDNKSCRLVLKERFKKSSPRRRFVRGYLDIENGTAYFVPNEGQGNGVLSSFVRCDMLAEIPEGSPPLGAGEMINAFYL